jgi:hypothetical protein
MQAFLDVAKTFRATRRPIGSTVRSLLVMAVALVVATAVGCGSESKEDAEPTAQVSGSVMVAGRPVPGGRVHFYSFESGVTGEAPLDRGGKFNVPSPLVPGEYTVYLSGARNVPEQFLSETSSGHTVTLVSGSNDLNIDLR